MRATARPAGEVEADGGGGTTRPGSVARRHGRRWSRATKQGVCALGVGGAGGHAGMVVGRRKAAKAHAASSRLRGGGGASWPEWWWALASRVRGRGPSGQRQKAARGGRLDVVEGGRRAERSSEALSRPRCGAGPPTALRCRSCPCSGRRATERAYLQIVRRRRGGSAVPDAGRRRTHRSGTPVGTRRGPYHKLTVYFGAQRAGASLRCALRAGARVGPRYSALQGKPGLPVDRTPGARAATKLHSRAEDCVAQLRGKPDPASGFQS